MPDCIGRMWSKIRVKGKPAGISESWKSVSAIEKGMKIVSAVVELEQTRIANLTHTLYADNREALPCAVTMFNSGTFPSTTLDEAVLRESIGLMPHEDLTRVERQLTEHVLMAAKADPWLRNNPLEVTTKGGYLAPGAEIPIDHPTVVLLGHLLTRVTDKQALISGRKDATDTRFLTRIGETPTVIFGPGVTSQMHAMN